MKRASTLASLAIATALAAGAAAQAPPAPQGPPAPPETAFVEDGAPVTLDGETLYYVHDFMGILTPQDRAITAERKLKQLADDPFYSPDLFSSEDVDGMTRIRYGDAVIALVSQEDAAAEQTTSDEVAAKRLHAIRAAIDKHRKAQLPKARMRALTVVLIATAALVLLLLGVRRTFGWLHTRIEASHAGRSVAALEARLGLKTEQAVALGQRVSRLLRIVIDILIFAVYLQVVFSFLPLTRGYALSVLQYVLEPIQRLLHGFLRNIGDLFTIAVLVVLFRYVIKGVRWLLYETADGKITIPGIAPEWGLPLYKIARIVLIAVAGVMIYPYIPGSDTQAFKGLGLFAGALFTLGASGAAGNFIGGLVAIFSGTFRIGDVVKVGDVFGVVTEMTMALTRIRTVKNEIVSIPNVAMLNGSLLNYSALAKEGRLILTTSVTIGYDAPWRTVHDLLVRAAKGTSRIEKEPAPFVLQTSLDDFYVSYQLNAYTKEPVMMRLIYGELHQNIQDAFNEGGVEIMSPHYASLRDGNTVTIPEDKRPEGYAAPRFELRVERTGDGAPTP